MCLRLSEISGRQLRWKKLSKIILAFALLIILTDKF
jgi:hypothetical protein